MLGPSVVIVPVTVMLPPETSPTVLMLAAEIDPPPDVFMLLLLGESGSPSQPFAFNGAPRPELNGRRQFARCDDCTWVTGSATSLAEPRRGEGRNP